MYSQNIELLHISRPSEQTTDCAYAQADLRLCCSRDKVQMTEVVKENRKRNILRCKKIVIRVRLPGHSAVYYKLHVQPRPELLKIPGK